MFHFYDGYHWFGMHLFWWVFWFLSISIIFGLYEPIRKRGRKNGRP